MKYLIILCFFMIPLHAMEDEAKKSPSTSTIEYKPKSLLNCTLDAIETMCGNAEINFPKPISLPIACVELLAGRMQKINKMTTSSVQLNKLLSIVAPHLLIHAINEGPQRVCLAVSQKNTYCRNLYKALRMRALTQSLPEEYKNLFDTLENATVVLNSSRNRLKNPEIGICTGNEMYAVDVQQTKIVDRISGFSNNPIAVAAFSSFDKSRVFFVGRQDGYLQILRPNQPPLFFNGVKGKPTDWIYFDGTLLNVPDQVAVRFVGPNNTVNVRLWVAKDRSELWFFGALAYKVPVKNADYLRFDQNGYFITGESDGEHKWHRILTSENKYEVVRVDPIYSADRAIELMEKEKAV